MRINHNLQAINTQRQMGVTQLNQAKSMEKLSSGYRINKAGDDAAGLAISEKMRGQIRGLNQASRNAQDGISLIQTAEGALSESQNILQRMRELAVQASNDTNVDADREAIQNEVNELTKEINRISSDTEFNTQKLLDGDFKDKKLQIGANQGQSIDLNIESMTALGLGLDGKTAKIEANSDFAATTIGSGDKQLKITYNGGSEKEITLTEKTYNTLDDLVDEVNKQINADSDLKDNVHATTDKTGKKLVIETVRRGDGEKVKIAAGTSDALTKLKLSAGNDTGGDKAGIAGVEGSIDLRTQAGASAAIKDIDNANKAISAQRAQLGALQNRLEHTIANDDTTAENLQAAESRIRDVDMAKEMMEFTKNNILSQASQAMLAQAKQAPQSVLQLLR